MTIASGVTKSGNWYFVYLNADEIAELDRPVNGRGGIEDFLRRLQKEVNHTTKAIKLSVDDLSRIPHFAFDMKRRKGGNAATQDFRKGAGAQTRS